MTDPHAVAPGEKPPMQARTESTPEQRRQTKSTARRKPSVAWAIYGVVMIGLIGILVYALA